MEAAKEDTTKFTKVLLYTLLVPVQDAPVLQPPVLEIACGVPALPHIDTY